MKELKIFISSPGDVIKERNIARVVIKRLESQFSGYFKLTPVLWEYEDLESSKHFNKQLVKPSECDMVICIFWSRLGSKPSEEFRRNDGTLYNSGTEWEFENAINAGVPTFTYFKNEALSIPDKETSFEKEKREEQIRNLQNFRSIHFGDADKRYINACHDFFSEQDFEQKIEEHLKKRLIKYLPKYIYEPEIKPEWTKGSPFKGLSSFEVEDEMIFKGRDTAIKEVVEKLQKNLTKNNTSLLFVLGMSGCGKSSLIKGGVIPSISKPGALAQVGFWNKVIFKPSLGINGLFKGFSNALYNENYLSTVLRNQGIDRNKLASLLQDYDNDSLNNFVQNILLETALLAKENDPFFIRVPESRMIVYIDQFEELFSLDSIDNNEKELFVSFLINLSMSGFVTVIASLRSDCYHKLSELSAIKSIKLNEFIYNLQPPTFVELSQMIRYPAMLAGLKFGKNPKTNENLDSILLEIASKNPESLPLLEFTLEELYKNRNLSDNGLTYEAYEKLGGMEGALAKRAEEVLLSIDDKAQSELFNVFRKLVAQASQLDKEAYKFSAKTEFYENIATSPAKIRFLDTFIDARLLVVDEIDGKKTVRVTHESLFKTWERLSKVLQSYIEYFNIRQKLESSYNEWNYNKRSKDYLLKGGKPLEDAKSFLKHYKNEVDNLQLLKFIKVSIRADRNKRWIKLFSIFSIIIISLSTIILNYVKEWKIENYSELYQQEIDNLQQHIPEYKIYEEALESCDYYTGSIYDLNDYKGNKKIQKSCEIMQKTACELYPSQAKCISATIKNAQNKSVLKDYNGALALLKSVEKPASDYFNSRAYYDPDPYMLNNDVYAAYSQVYFGMGDYKKADDYTEKAAVWGAKEYKANYGLANYAYYRLADNYFYAKNYKKAIFYYNKIKLRYSIFEAIKHPDYVIKDISLGATYAKKQIEICKKELNKQ